jgi:membrane protein
MSSEAESTAHPAQQGWFARTSASAIRRLLRFRIVRAALLYTGRRGPMLADAVTYRALFSVFAAVLLGFSAAALWLSQDAVAWTAVVSAVDSAVPGLVSTDQEKGLIDLDQITAPASLSVAGVVSLVGLIGSALGAIGSMRNAVRTIAGTESADVAWWLALLRSVLLALIIGGGFVGAAALTFAGDAVVGWMADIVGVPDDSPAVFWTVRLLSHVIVFALDALLIAAVYRMLSGVRAGGKALWGGALVGAAGLLVLQELSGLFVGGAKSNPLLASFASLLALLLWLNLSTQVILLASALITVSHREQSDRVAERFGAETLPEFALRRAEDDVRAATAALRAAQKAAAPDHP